MKLELVDGVLTYNDPDDGLLQMKISPENGLEVSKMVQGVSVSIDTLSVNDLEHLISVMDFVLNRHDAMAEGLVDSRLENQGFVPHAWEVDMYDGMFYAMSRDKNGSVDLYHSIPKSQAQETLRVLRFMRKQVPYWWRWYERKK